MPIMEKLKAPACGEWMQPLHLVVTHEAESAVRLASQVACQATLAAFDKRLGARQPA